MSPAGYFIARVLEIAGVDKWSRLPGCIVRAVVERDTSIVAIGHALKNNWFYPALEIPIEAPRNNE